MANLQEYLNPPQMYRLRPYFEIKKVKLPDCMYLLKPVHQLTNIATTGEGSSSALSYLENRQEWVLSQIGKLQDKVKILGEKLGVGPAEVGILQQQNSLGTAPKDVVISCPFSSPPYALLTLCHFICGHVPTAYSVHVHSSATSNVTEDLKRFLDSLPSASNPSLRVVLIWKSESECSVPTMVVSPHNQTPVEGTANIARYLCREYYPILYEEANGGIEATAQIDSWLDIVSTTLLRGSAKEKSSVLKRFNSQLGSTSFLVGNQLSLADIVAYCTLCKQPGLKIPGNLNQWLKKMQVTVPGSAESPYLNIESS